MIHPVTVKDKKGKVLQVVDSQKLSELYWEAFELGDPEIIGFEKRKSKFLKKQKAKQKKKKRS